MLPFAVNKDVHMYVINKILIARFPRQVRSSSL